MASLSQISSGACLSLRKNCNASPTVRLGNVRYSSRLVANEKNHAFQLSAKGENGRLRIGEKRKDQWSVLCSHDGLFDTDNHEHHKNTPPEELIKLFFESINAKDTRKLFQLISDDCQMQDLLFFDSLKDKKEVLYFLLHVMEAMGNNVHFITESILEGMFEGENTTVSVMWDLAWKGTPIPSTTGHTIFECGEHNGKLVIREIRGVEEHPVKPGVLLLKLFKVATTVFDCFTFATEELLLK